VLTCFSTVSPATTSVLFLLFLSVYTLPQPHWASSPRKEALKHCAFFLPYKGWTQSQAKRRTFAIINMEISLKAEIFVSKTPIIYRVCNHR
jgi:hypothetical protein